MARYRKKPVEIEAVQYGLAEYADNPWVIRGDVPQWLQDAAHAGTVVPEFRSEDYWYLKIKTLEGDMLASPDDWIIRGVKGELYPCKPDVFAATYEAAPDDAADNRPTCDAQPPETGTWGDCWCTLPPGHTGEHRCQPCTDRHGAPGWTYGAVTG